APCPPPIPRRFSRVPPRRRFYSACPILMAPRASAHRLTHAKAAEGCRTPKRWRDHHGLPNLRQVLECAAPAALLLRVPDNCGAPSFSSSPRQFESGRGLPHSKTLARPPCAPQISARFWSAPPL